MLNILRLRRFNWATRTRLTQAIAEADRANQARDWATAEAFYRQALTIDPMMPGILVQLGHSLKEQGFLQGAETAYRGSLKLSPNNSDTYLQLGHVLKLEHRFRDAATAYRSAGKLDPTSDDFARELKSLEDVSLVDWSGPRERDIDFIDHVYGDADLVRTGGSYDSLGDLLATTDMSPGFLPLFDEDFYVSQHAGLQGEIARPNRSKCLVHFCETGIQSLYAISEDLVFDSDFYVETYLPGQSFDAVAAYRHWLNIGLSRGWAANRSSQLRAIFGSTLQNELVPNGFIEAALKVQQGHGQWEDLFDCFMPATQAGSPQQMALSSALTSVSLRLQNSGSGEAQRGIRLTQRLLRGDAPPALRFSYALHTLQRRGCELEAIAIYDTLLEGGYKTARLYDELASCLASLGSLDRALAVILEALTLFPGDLSLVRQFDAIAERVLTQAWRIAESLGQTDIAAAQSYVSKAVSIVSQSMTGPQPLRKKPIRSIAIVGNRDLDQCRFYRLDQKQEQLELAGYRAVVFDFHHDIPAFLSRIVEFEAVIFYRVPAHYSVIRAITQARELGLATFYEIDDLIFDPQHYPSSFESYGGQIDRHDYLGLALGVPLFAEAMRLCEFGLASTPTLADNMRSSVASGEVFVHRNAFGSLHTEYASRSFPPPDPSKVTLLYASGTKAHKEDFQELVEPALIELVRRHGTRISIVLIGSFSLSDNLQSIRDNVVLLDLMPIKALWSLIASVDINIAVLKRSFMADAKSEIKWMEAAMFGVPSVVSDTTTYREVIEPGVTGFLCSSPEDWTETLDRLVVDPALRRSVGAKARAAVLDRYGMPSAAENLSTIMTAVVPNEALVAKPKILVVNVYYPPQAIGGATRVVHDNVRQIKSRYGEQVDLEVFCSVDGGLEPYVMSSYVMDGVRVTGITTPNRPDIDHVVADPKMGECFTAFLRDTKPSLIHFHCIQRLTVSVVDAAREAGVPYVVTVHDGWWISGQQFLLNKALELELYAYDDPARTRRELGRVDYERLEKIRPALTQAAKVLAVSEPFADIYRGCGVPNVLAIPNGVSNDMVVQRHASSDGRVRLGFVGGPERHKGSQLIKAALQRNEFQHLSLLVVDHGMTAGDGRQERWGSTDVTFIPKRRQNEVAALYGQIDVLLAPSIWPESYGLVTREALQCGCWVIASDRGSIAEDVVENENGFVIDVVDEQPLADVLRRIDCDRERFRAPPALNAVLRASVEQADDLAALYFDMSGAKSLVTVK
ncbi:glycosyltransferase [Lichenihabitans psoromatis]|uniref:glycosyltransferase n=1 Tax=Lichenihabitans psoromatis TaxID=2528642 RepID=UPI0010385CD5|nr:glycosyltransferase [Lichenihabitans psoromatis]